MPAHNSRSEGGKARQIERQGTGKRLRDRQRIKIGLTNKTTSRLQLQKTVNKWIQIPQIIFKHSEKQAQIRFKHQEINPFRPAIHLQPIPFVFKTPGTNQFFRNHFQQETLHGCRNQGRFRAGKFFHRLISKVLQGQIYRFARYFSQKEQVFYQKAGCFRPFETHRVASGLPESH